jgi:ferredoxin
MHYCAKDGTCTAFANDFEPMQASGKLHFHFDGGDPKAGLDIARLLSEPGKGEHVYYCGPSGFMRACEAATAHWPKGTVHFEHFKVPEKPAAAHSASAIDGFMVRIASTGQELAVSNDQSIVDALAEAGIEIETSCRAGLCGTCKTRYLSGVVEHNDCILDEDEKGEFLTTCVSRAKSPLLVLDL